MERTGAAKLWLVEGPVPHYREMVRLGTAISATLINEMGVKGFIERISDPLWFSCLSCVLGFEANTSGQTTVTLKALKEGLASENLGLKIAGGKGRAATAARSEVDVISEELGLSSQAADEIKRASRMSCKVDNTALQDSYTVYFHSVLIGEDGSWACVNQGMNVEDGTARRYHWAHGITSFVDEPHSNIVGDDRRPIVLDLTSKDSRNCREAMVDIVREKKPLEIQRMLLFLFRQKGQTKLLDFIKGSGAQVLEVPGYLSPPKKVGIEALSMAREYAKDFEGLLGVKGIGPSTIRGLAYVSSLIYGAKCSWIDPVRYTWAYGTKSGRPRFVEKEAMKRSAEILRKALEDAKVGSGEKLNAIRRLKAFLTAN